MSYRWFVDESEYDQTDIYTKIDRWFMDESKYDQTDIYTKIDCLFNEKKYKEKIMNCNFCKKKLGRVYYKIGSISFCPSCHSILLFMKNEMLAKKGEVLRDVYTWLYDNPNIYNKPIKKIVKKK